jgi:methionine-gamma-lyase
VPVTPPIYQTSTFRAPSVEEFARMAVEKRNDHFYTRCGNPTLSEAEDVLAQLEGGESALVTGSGMAAISTTVLTFVSAGDQVIAQHVHYAGTTSFLREFLPRFGVTVSFVDQTNPAGFEKALTANTKVILVETPSNPLLRLTDLRRLSAFAKEHGLLTIVDNTIATPINQQPLKLGIDLVVHSGTKYLSGHSDVSAGVVIGSQDLTDRIWETVLLLGPVLGPFDAWLLLRGLRSLPLRVERQNRTAAAVAEFLTQHAKVSQVHYVGLESHAQRELAVEQMSGFTGMLSFELESGQSGAERLISALRLITHASSFGGVESLIVCPAMMEAHMMSEEQFDRVGVKAGLVRLSVGVENERDLISDLAQALEQV